MLTDEQKKKRIGLVTSSTAAGALGLHPYMTPMQAWLAIRGELPSVDTKATDRGNRLEDAIIQYGADAVGLIRSDAGFVEKGWSGDSADSHLWEENGTWDGCNPVAVIEAKSASQFTGSTFGEEGTDQVPDHVAIQSHWHMIHWPTARFCVVPVLVGGFQFEFRHYIINRDEELQTELYAKLGEWHREYIIGEKMPPAQAADDELIASRLSVGSAGAMADTPEIEALARVKDEMSAERRLWETREKEAKARLRQLLGDYESVKAHWGSISYKNSKGRQYTDWQAIARHITGGSIDPELIKEYTSVKPGPRVLRVTVKKQRES